MNHEPLQALHATHGALLGNVAGKAVPLNYGDFEGEVGAISNGLAVAPREGCEVMVVSGADAAVFLNGLTTNDEAGLTPGAAHPALLCATKGKILHEVTVVRAKETDYLLVTEPGEGAAVAGHLSHYHIREALQMGRVDLVRIDLLGPSTAEGLAALGIGPAEHRGEFRGAPVLAARLPLGAVARIMLLVPGSAAPELVEALLAAVGGARLVGLEALEEARIWAGVPRFGSDYGTDHLPAEGALYDHISFAKGCYVGQEIHARMHYRGHPNRKLAAIEFPEIAGGVAAVSGALFLEEAEIGSITSLARLSRAGRLRGIALLRYKETRDFVPLSLGAGSPAVVETAPLATDLGQGRA